MDEEGRWGRSSTYIRSILAAESCALHMSLCEMWSSIFPMGSSEFSVFQSFDDS